jgi:S1-C subfamily serine protease
MQQIYNSIIRIISNNQDYDYLNPPNILIENQSIGTGFFISSKIIITCSHVIDNGNILFFTMPSISNKKYKLKILGIAPDIDLAILESIDYISDNYLQLIDSDLIKLQDSIRVIGFPLGQDKIKVTKGIISGIQSGKIQIDSAINGGNSGGPLIDVSNNVIGVVSSKISNASGVGYAIPTKLLNIFNPIDIKRSIYYSCNFLTLFSNTSEHRINMINKNLKEQSIIESGYTVSLISKYSPLINIDIMIGDLIIEFDNILINNFGELNIKLASKYDLTDYVDRLQPEKNYNIKFYSLKNNRIINAQIKFQNKNLIGIKKLIPIFDKLEYLDIGGLILTQLTQNVIINQFKHLKKYLYYNEIIIPRILVANILPNSQFKLSENINQGDIIVKINFIEVFTIDDVKQILKNLIQNEKYLTFETNKNLIDTISIETLKSLDN